jgi:rhodanese-related sulfurtransferase
MTKSITVAELSAVIDDLDLALIDVRETGEYNTAHIPGSWSLPRRQLETRIAEMVPWHGARIVVCDDDGARAALAAATMESLGYNNVSVLAGGSNRWVTEGHGTDWGVNVPSKDFGERWLMTENVPELEPDELHEWIERGDKFILVDSRTPEEHHRACIPGSRSMPGAELGLRMWQLAEDAPKDTPIVVHCAGRTRSIIGAGTLRRMGFENVYALKNGTMGWQLAGLQVEEGSDRLDMPKPSAANVAKASETARRIAEGDGVQYIDQAGLDAIKARAGSENVYLLDVRTREEYAAGHPPGFRHAPGGQTVQASDSYVGVRGGTIVFACDASNVRSSMTAGWFRRMGFPNVYVLEGGVDSGAELEKVVERRLPAGYENAHAGVHLVSPDALQSMTGSVRIVFTGTSEEFSAGHIPGSRWLPRGWLELWADDIVPGESATVLVTDSDTVGGVLAAAQLRAIGYRDVLVLEGGIAAWRKDGAEVETGLTGVMRAPDDVLPVRRSYAEMLNYLRWEEALGEKYREQTER